MKDRYRFAELLLELRKRQKITQEQLCYGVCSLSLIGKIEKGERYVGKAMRDCLLERLGFSSDGYEVFLGCDDYERYENRQKILNSIAEEDFLSAESLTEKYKKNLRKNPLEEQFYFTVCAELAKQGGVKNQERLKLLERAVHLTMPDIEDRRIKELCLSPKEIYLLIEYMTCIADKDLESWYEEVIEYLDGLSWNKINIAKVYPMAILYYCYHMEKKTMDLKTLKRVLQYCCNAIEILRNAKKSYFLWELLEVKEKMLNAILERVIGEEKKNYLELLQKTKEWKKALRLIVREIHFPKELEDAEEEEYLQTRALNYLYCEQGVYQVGKVISIRRKMLGMTRKELCEGICAEKTLVAIEKCKQTPQEEIRVCLFERLHLSAEYQSRSFVAEQPEAYMLDEEYAECVNQKKWDVAEKILEELNRYLDSKIILNRQYMLRERTTIACGQGKITSDELVDRYKMALEYTMPLKRICESDEVYFTMMEIFCLYSIAKNSGIKENIQYTQILRKNFEHPEHENDLISSIGMYELVMTHLASELGNIDKFEQSDQLSRKILKECFQRYRLNMASMNLHSILWNYRQSVLNNKRADRFIAEEEWLKVCIEIADFSKEYFYTDWYKKEYAEWKTQ